MLTSVSETQQLQEALNAAIPDLHWLHILEVFVPTGVADSLQIQEISGLDRSRLRRFLEKMEQSALGLAPVLNVLDTSVRRVGIHGRPPKVYLLGKSGAALLQANGYEDARPCSLRDEIAVSHAMAMLSIQHAAQQAGCLVQTDQNLSYGNGQVLRPDHQVVLPDGDQALYEVEQEARRKLIPRILESLKNKQAFFQTEQSKVFLPEVRMVINLEYGQKWNRTLSVWREACNLVIQQNKAPLGFRLLAIPIQEFLRSPEWEVELSARWQDFSAPTKKQSLQETEESEERIAELGSSHTIDEDCILLEALRQDYIQNKLPDIPAPELRLFDLALVIHSASRPDPDDIYTQIAPQHTSIYLLKRYLEMRPDLVRDLRKAIHSGRGRMYWSPKTILHRMQMTINTFLAYYGWQSGGRIKVMASMEHNQGATQFGVKVEATNMFLYGSDHQKNRDTERALAWVLWALFEYAAELGLGKPEFW
jgi:hypothetical protein